MGGGGSMSILGITPAMQMLSPMAARALSSRGHSAS